MTHDPLNGDELYKLDGKDLHAWKAECDRWKAAGHNEQRAVSGVVLAEPSLNRPRMAASL